MTATQCTMHTRFMRPADLKAVTRIEDVSFEYPWNEKDFTACMNHRRCVCLTAEHELQVVGFIVYDLEPACIRLANIAIAPEFRRLGFASQMMERLKRRAEDSGRKKIELEVRESNLDAQLFFRALGFRAISVLKGFYEDSTEDAYAMEWSV